MPYNSLLKRISNATNLSIEVLHTVLCKFVKKHGTNFTAHKNENPVILLAKYSNKYLYNTYVSSPEKDNITADIEKVVVYKKIARSSITIPTITAVMYSSSFMYIVKHKNGDKDLSIVVENKDIENKTVLQDTVKVQIESAKVFFEILTTDGYKVYFRDQLDNKQ